MRMPRKSTLSAQRELFPTEGVTMAAVDPRRIPAFGATFFENQITRLLTVGELARALQCSAGTIRNWIWKREIPIVRIGRRIVRFNAQEIREWLSERNGYS